MSELSEMSDKPQPENLYGLDAAALTERLAPFDIRPFAARTCWLDSSHWRQ